MFSLKLRLLFLSIIPAILLTVLSFFVLLQEYKNRDNLELTKNHVKDAEAISTLIHLLQTERGLSVGFVTVGNKEAKEKLIEVRKSLDNAAKDLESLCGKDDYNYHILEILKDIEIKRSNIDSLKIPASDVKIYYTGKVNSLIDIIKIVPTIIEDREDRNLIQAYSYLVTAKERLGFIRATLYETFMKKSSKDNSYFQFMTNFELYNTSLLNFITIAPKNLLKFYENSFSSKETTETFKVIDAAIRKEDKIEPSYWFEQSTKSINLLHGVELKLFKITNDLIEQKLETTSQKIKILIFLLASIVMVFGVVVLYTVRTIFVSTRTLKQDYSNSIFMLKQYKATVDRSFIVSKTDAKGIITYVNDEFCKISGYSREELLGKSHNILRHPDTKIEVFEDLWHTIKDLKQPWFGDVKGRKKDGSDYWVDSIISPIFDEQGNLIEYIAIRTDITQQKQILQYFEERLLLTEKNFDYSVHLSKEYEKAIDLSVILSKADKNGKITYVNDKFLDITGYTLKEVIGKNHSIFRTDETRIETYNKIRETITSGCVWQGVLKNRTKAGKHYWSDTTIVPIRDVDNSIIEYLTIRFDVTEIMEQRKAFETAAKTDSLTGYGNRFKLNSDIKELSNPSIAIFNLDNFKELNDFYGHQFGDLAIKEVATRIHQVILKDKDLDLYRLQGDEFVLLASSYSKGRFVKKCHHILNEIKENFDIQNEQINISCSCGVSFEERDLLFTTADMILTIAKKDSVDLLVYSDSKSLSKEYENNISWAKKLKNALQNDRMVVYYQPIINNFDLSHKKYECLVRMIDENGAVISPFFFLDIAKKTKQYLDITRTVIAQSFEMFKDKNVEFSINLSIKDIMEPTISIYLFSMLKEYNIGKRVVFEIVESELIKDFESVISFIEKVKEYGCKIAIDDFGTGYSNFAYLIDLKADYLKIDGSLIKNIDKDEDALLVVSAIVDFSKKLKMKIIAEFVESETIYNMVKELGIEYSQGYYFSQAKQEL